MLHVDIFSSKICLPMRFTKKTAKHNRTLRLSVNLWLLETSLPMWLQQRKATNSCKTQWGEPLQCTKRLPCAQACQCKLQPGKVQNAGKFNQQNFGHASFLQLRSKTVYSLDAALTMRFATRQSQRALATHSRSTVPAHQNCNFTCAIHTHDPTKGLRG